MTDTSVGSQITGGPNTCSPEMLFHAGSLVSVIASGQGLLLGPL